MTRSQLRLQIARTLTLPAETAMPITFNCPCGKALRIADENAGKRVKCPACQAIGTAPSAAPKFEVVEDEPPAKPAPAKPKSVAKAAVEDDNAGFTVEDDEDEKPKPKKKSIPAKSSREDDEDEDERPKKKKKPRREDDEDERPRRRRPSGNPDAGKKILYLAGGLILTLVGIGVAVYWWQTEPHQYVGRRPFNGYIFGGVCAVVGFLTTIKGITGRFGDDE